MRYTHIPLQDFIQSHSIISPAQDILQKFQQHLEIYLKNISAYKNESEEYQKNLLRDFLIQAFEYNCNTKDRIDLAIYEDSAPKVLFEVKSLSNKSEFIGGGGQIP
ncbi:DUF7149 domain-containing protein [Helicobacter mesocricetorum]|uniref:DUF7149 domain-containing protein n=1 Tax=Helicobacter mesocricetorum TaxID=87012 RepID=UPI000CF0B12E|nr:hypothetical protein [Helicobacter mesocricetorum]